ncbi:MAG: nitronate monooxygenase [Burkholderiales bacterium]|nr:nitronate monooxygenase [Burkholderiales bacterium]
MFAAPMFLISGPELVIAACRAGIIGAFPTPNARPIGVLDEWMARITGELARLRAADPDALIGPWAANLVTHSTNTRLPEDLKLVARYKPPIVITALGSPRPAIEVVHGYGGLVFADVINLKLARKAAEAGVDGLACVGAGAGGHTGNLTPFAFVPAVREFFDGHIVIGGGIADGTGVFAARALGADLIYMGTRFIPSAESMAEDAYKRMIIDCNADDLLVSAAITGSRASWLKPSLAANGLDPDNLPEVPKRDYDSNTGFKDKRWLSVWAAGQGVGASRAVEPVGAIVDELERDYRAAAARARALA